MASSTRVAPLSKDSLFIGSLLDSKSQASLASYSLEELQFSSTFRHQYTQDYPDKKEKGIPYSLEVHRVLDVIEQKGEHKVATNREVLWECVERRFVGKEFERYSGVEYSDEPVDTVLQSEKNDKYRYSRILSSWFKRISWARNVNAT